MQGHCSRKARWLTQVPVAKSTMLAQRKSKDAPKQGRLSKNMKSYTQAVENVPCLLLIFCFLHMTFELCVRKQLASSCVRPLTHCLQLRP